MADPFRKVTPGQPLRIPAAAYNAFLDAAQLARQGQASIGAAPQVGQRFPGALGFPGVPGLALVRNGSGLDVPRFGVLAIRPAILPPAPPASDPDAVSGEFYNRTFLLGTGPGEASSPGRFAITLEPIAAGRMGVACVDGICPARLTPPDPEAGWSATQFPLFADATPGSVSTLRPTGLSGGAQVLWMDSPGGGDPDEPVWAIVRLGSGGCPVFRAKLTSEPPAGDTYEWEALDLPLVSTPVTLAREINGRKNIRPDAVVFMFWPPEISASGGASGGPFFDMNFGPGDYVQIPDTTDYNPDTSTWDLEGGFNGDGLNTGYWVNLVTRHYPGDITNDKLPQLFRRLFTAECNGQSQHVDVEIGQEYGIILTDVPTNLVYSEGNHTLTYMARKVIALGADEGTEQTINLQDLVGADEKVKVTSADTTPGYLAEKLVTTDPWIRATVQNPAAAETLLLEHTGPGVYDINATTPVLGDVDIDDYNLNTGGALVSFHRWLVRFDEKGHRVEVIDDDPPSATISVPQVLGDLADVDAASPSDGDLLTWDGGAGLWRPAPPGGGSGPDEKVKIDGNDPAAGYLANKLLTVDPWISRTLTPGGGGGGGAGGGTMTLAHTDPQTAYADWDMPYVVTWAVSGANNNCGGASIAVSSARRRFDAKGHHTALVDPSDATPLRVPQVLDDLADVSVANPGPAVNDMLRWSGSAWTLVTPVEQTVLTAWRYHATTHKFQVKTRVILCIPTSGESDWTDVAEGSQPVGVTVLSQSQVDGANLKFQNKNRTAYVVEAGGESGWNDEHTGQNCAT